ncbi:MAG TPA: CocE/NonD family hydrolase [Gaiellaceae bacterium]|nr:CocE/NonD family hydrolase [Gaiellaceae bacterium]
MNRRVFLLALVLLVAVSASGRASAATQELTLHMDDGVGLSATLYEPSTAPPPSGYPAIVLFHAIGGKRQDLAAVAQRFSGSFAVLAFDARGHGASGGLVSIDGPREIADTRTIFQQLAARPEIDDVKIGAWGISLGGGAVLRSLVDGVPWAAVETVQSWTDLYSALAPQNLAKSGAIFQFLSSVPLARLDPSVLAIRDDALASRNLGVLRTWADARSSRKLLATVRTPTFLFQGRRDFAFDIAQAKTGYSLLKGPKRLYVGDFGHSPSTFPGPDIEQLTSLGLKWFARYLVGASPAIAQISLAPSPWRGKPRTYAQLPAIRRLTIPFPGSDHLAGAGRAVRTSGRFTGRAETFGSGSVQLRARLSGGWSRVVAVLTAQPRKGSEVVVSEGGVNTTGLSGKRRLTIRLIDTATLIPQGAQLRLTLASSSVAQNPANLLYLNLPMPRSSRIALGAARLTLPILRKPVSR